MLSEAQLGFFARNGYLHVSRWVDAETCSKLVDHTWTRLPPTWQRNDPATWQGSAGDSCHIADLRVRRGLFQFQKGDLFDNPLVEGAFAAEAVGGKLAHGLLAYPLTRMHILESFFLSESKDRMARLIKTVMTSPTFVNDRMYT